MRAPQREVRDWLESVKKANDFNAARVFCDWLEGIPDRRHAELRRAIDGIEQLKSRGGEVVGIAARYAMLMYWMRFYFCECGGGNCEPCLGSGLLLCGDKVKVDVEVIGKCKVCDGTGRNVMSPCSCSLRRNMSHVRNDNFGNNILDSSDRNA